MKTTVITTGSVTYAIKAKKLLAREGIASKLIKADVSKTKSGCSYGVEFPSSEFYTAANILRSNGIRYGVYEK